MRDVLEFGTGIAVLHVAFMVRVAGATERFLRLYQRRPSPNGFTVVSIDDNSALPMGLNVR
jgi:hypothetical protein